jgi:hypothetical protein
MIDDLLKKFNIDRSTLTSVEMDTLSSWAEALRQKRLMPDDVLAYVNSMIESLERELCGYEQPKGLVGVLFRGKRHRHIEARLLNYLMLRDFLSSPERAQKYIEGQLKNLTNQVAKAK